MEVYNVKSVQAVQFTSEDVMIFVQWEDSLYHYPPEIHHAGTIIQPNEIDRFWRVKWDASWIKLSQLNGSKHEWLTFYRSVVISQLQQRFNNEGDIFIH